MDLKLYYHLTIVVLGIGIFSTFISFNIPLTIEYVNAQMKMGGGDGSEGHDMSMGGSSGMGGEGGHDMSMGGSSGMGGEGGHSMEMPGMVQQMCHMGKDMPPHYCEPAYMVMSSAKGLKIVDVNPINDNELQVIIANMNSVSNTTNQLQQNIVVVGGGEDLAGSTVLDISGLKKITTELKLIESGFIYNHEKIHLHIFPLTKP